MSSPAPSGGAASGVRSRSSTAGAGVPAGPSSGHLAGPEQVRHGRPEVVVPVADRIGLVQHGGDPGVLALLAALLVGLGVRAARHGRRRHDDVAGVGRHRERRDPRGAVDHGPRLAAVRGQHPQRRLRVAVLRRAGIGPGGGEQQRAVRRPGGGGLAGGAAGQPVRRPLAGRVDLPQRRLPLLLLRVQGLHRDRQARAVGRQGQAADPRQGHEVGQPVERGRARGVVGGLLGRSCGLAHRGLLLTCGGGRPHRSEPTARRAPGPRASGERHEAAELAGGGVARQVGDEVHRHLGSRQPGGGEGRGRARRAAARHRRRPGRGR